MSDAIHILMIDDDEEDYIIIRDIIGEIEHNKYIIDWVGSYDEGLEQIQKKKYHLYLVDYRLGSRTGDELIKEAIDSGCEEPMILLTGQNNIETDNKALAAGASDFLVKGSFTPRTFESTIRYSIAQARHIQQIRYVNAELENRVKERTEVLEKANRELTDTRVRLEEALLKEKELNELKSRFVSMASHEFRTPLATILSSLSLIARYNEMNDFEKQLKHIDRINNSVENLTDIINDVLSLSKLEEGRITQNQLVCNIKKLTEEIISELKTITKKDQEIKYSHTGNDSVIIDPKIYKHILTNLISNAIKFSPPEKEIVVKTSMNDSGFDFSVKDSGVGISKEDQQHLFERFFRGGNVTNIQGTGLGLNIVAKYVEFLNGSIKCDSDLNKGTEFSISIPENK